MKGSTSSLPKLAISLLATIALTYPTLTLANAPFIESKNDIKHLGSPENFLFWTPKQQVSGYRNLDKIFPTRRIKAIDNAPQLPRNLQALSDIPLIGKGAAQGKNLSLKQYLKQQNVAGLLVIKDGVIRYEQYGLGNTKDSLWVSFSVAKSVTSMLIGAAVKDGYIGSLDDKVTDYLPRLKNSAYDKSTVKNIMQMSSGVSWNEDYADPTSDINQAVWDTRGLIEYLRNKPRNTEPGDSFNYNTAETNLAGTLLRSAIGNNLSTYLTHKIWQPYRMTSDANWMLDEPAGGEQGGCCINATLRDYGRLGLFALNNGRLADGSSVLPDNWMQQSTTPSNAYPGYGYMWWLNADGSYDASGIFGQGIYINPEENLVIAIHSARNVASDKSDWALQDALYEAITTALSKTK